MHHHEQIVRAIEYDAFRPVCNRAATTTHATKRAGRTRIDTLVISHADTDHFNAVPELIDRFTIGEIVVAPPFLRSDSLAVTDVLRRARRAGITVRTVTAGDSFAIDPLCRVRVLHPP
ncbi:MAG: MBL fold metallo-hydrolase, partial [Proteobacteria bacterium]|nr:MBL fold metallo-hydrolase [Pseudomonadota bacterium]